MTETKIKPYQGGEEARYFDNNPVDHPDHYNNHPSGVECIDVVEHMTFNLGNAMKYIWRADHKRERLEDLQKAAWYIDREIQRIERDGNEES